MILCILDLACLILGIILLLSKGDFQHNTISDLEFQRLTSPVSITFLMITCNLNFILNLDILLSRLVYDLRASKQRIPHMFVR